MLPNELMSLKITRDYQVSRLKNENALAVPQSDWDQIRNQIKCLQDPNRPVFKDVAMFLFGVAATALLSAITMPNATDADASRAVICWAIFAVALISGVVCIVMHQYLGTNERKRAGDLSDFMDQVEEKQEHGG